MDASTDGGRECPRCEKVKTGLFHVDGHEIVCTECYGGATSGPRHPF